MSTNELIQWICVGVIFIIIIVWVARYLWGLVKWSKAIKKQGGSSLPPCCGGKVASKSPCLSCEKECKLPGNSTNHSK